MSATLGDAILYLKTNNDALNAGIADAEKRANGFISSSLRSVSSGMTQVGGAMTGMVTLPILGAAAAMIKFGSDSVKASADLEKEMSGVQAVLGASSGDMAKLNALAAELGLDPHLVVTTVQAADAMQMLAKNGLTVDQILGGATRSTILLANATGADFGQAAAIATDAMRVFGINAQDMEKAISGVTSVTTNSKFTINDYQMALAQGGGTAAALGVNFGDFNTAIAAISSNFNSGADAGTNFKVMLQYMVPKSKPAIAAMKELGLMTEDGKNQFFDASGNMKSMSDVAGILQKATAGLSDEERNHALSVIFGTDALRSALGMAKIGKKGFDDLKKTMGKTDAEEQAKIRMDNLAGTMEILKGITETLQLKFGDVLNPAIRKVAATISDFLSNNGDRIIALGEKVGTLVAQLLPQLTTFFLMVIDKILGWVEAFTKLDPQTQNFILMAIGIAAALGPLLLALGMFASIIGGVIAILGGIFSPIGLLIGIVGLLAAAWIGNWGDIQNKIGPVGEFIKGAIGGIWEAISNFLNNPLIQEFGNKISTLFSDGFQLSDIWSVLSAIIELIYKWITSPEMTAAIQGATTWLGNKVSEILGGIWAWITSPETLSQIQSGIGWLLGQLGGLVQSAGQWLNSPEIQTAIGTFVSSVGGSLYEGLTGSLGLLAQKMPDIIGNISAWFGNQFSDMVKWWDQHGESIKTIVGATWNFIQGKYEDGKKAIWNVIDGIRKWWEDHGATVMTIIDNNWKGINRTIEDWGKILGGVVDGIAAIIEGDWTKLGTSLGEISSGFGDILVTAFGTWKANLIAIAGDISGSIADQFTTEKFNNVGSNIGKWIGEGLNNFTIGLDSVKWEDVGIQIGKFITGRGFAWDNFATAMEESAKNFDWIKLGETVRNILLVVIFPIQAIQMYITQKIGEIDWEAIKTMIAEKAGAFIDGFVQGLRTGDWGGAIESMQKAGGDLFDGLIQGIFGDEEKKSGLQRTIEALGNIILSFFKGFFGISSPSTVMIEIGGQILDGLIQGLTNLPNLDNLYTLGTTLIERLREGIRSQIDLVRDALGDAIQNAINNLDALGSNLYETGVNIIGKLTDGIQSQIDFIQQTISNVIDSATTGLSVGTDALVNVGINIINGISDGLRDNWNELTNWINYVIRYAVAYISVDGTALLLAGANLIGFLTDGIWSKANDVLNTIGSVISWATSNLSVGTDALVSAGNSIIDGMRGGITSKWQDLSTAIQETVSWATSFLNLDYLKNMFINVGNVLMDSLSEGIYGKIGDVANTFAWLARLLPQWLKNLLGIASPSKVFVGIGENIGAGLALGIENSKIAAQEAIANMSATLIGGTGSGGNNPSTLNSHNTTSTQTYTLNIHTNAQIEPIRQDFEMLRLMAA